MRPVEEAELNGGAIEAKGSEPSRSTSTQPSAEVDDGPGVVDDSDSDDDRPSRWDAMGLRVGCQLLMMTSQT